MTVFVVEERPGVWLVRPLIDELTIDAPQETRFTGDAARDRAYAYVHWVNDHAGVWQQLSALRDEVYNLRDQLLPRTR